MKSIHILLVFLAIFVIQIKADDAVDPVVIREKQSQDFIDGLIQRQYFDVAIDYLNRLREAPNTPDVMRNRVDFRIGQVHIEALASGVTPLGLDAHLAQAKAAFEKYLNENPAGEDAFSAHFSLGKLQLEDARIAVQKSTQPGIRAVQKESFQLQARELLAEARDRFDAAEKIVYDIAKELQTDPETKTDPLKQAKQDTAHARLLDSRIRSAISLWEHAKTFEPDQPEYKAELTESIRLFHEIAVRYKDYTPSIEAKLYETKANRDLGNNKEARILLQELYVLPDANPVLRGILSETLEITLELNLEEPTPLNMADSVRRIEAWAKVVSQTDRQKRANARINILAGKTYMKFAEAATKQSEVAKLHATAVRYLNSVAQGTGEYREATQLLTNMNKNAVGDAAPDESDQISEPAKLANTFTDAKDAAEEKYQDFLIANRTVLDAENKNDKAEAEISRNKIAEHTVALFRRAFELKDDNTPIDPDELNSMRMKLANLYWSLGRIEEAIVIGDFFMNKYSATAVGPRGAELAIKGNLRLFIDAKNSGEELSELESITRRIAKTSDIIASHWDSLPVGRESQLIRIEMELDLGELSGSAGMGKFASAQKFIDELPANSPRKTNAELQLGQTLLNSYLKQTAAQKSDVNGKQLLAAAKKFLHGGLNEKTEQVKSGVAIDFLAVSAALSLSQIFMDENDYDSAMQILNDPDYGPMKILDVEMDETSEMNAYSTVLNSEKWNDNFKGNILASVLRVYIGQGTIEQAERIVARLETLSEVSNESGNDNSTKRLVGIYVQLGRQLEARLETMRKNGNSDDVEATSKAFVLFLDRISQRDLELPESTLIWIADTYYRLGNGAIDAYALDPPPVASETVEYFSKAARVYQTASSRNPASDALKLRLAISIRGEGNLDESLRLLYELLNESENRLDVQVEAARTLQMLGKTDKDYYVKAIVGDDKKPDGQYRVWGWNEIIRKVSKDHDKYKTAYYESYYNKAVCRIYLARELTGAESTKMSNGAKDDLARLRQLRPDLGGDVWSKRFETLIGVLR